MPGFVLSTCKETYT